MIALYDHIQELLAELRGCDMSCDEHAQVRAELAQARAEQVALDHAFDAHFEGGG
jgi:hypothetical protein